MEIASVLMFTLFDTMLLNIFDCTKPGSEGVVRQQSWEGFTRCLQDGFVEDPVGDEAFLGVEVTIVAGPHNCIWRVQVTL